MSMEYDECGTHTHTRDIYNNFNRSQTTLQNCIEKKTVLHFPESIEATKRGEEQRGEGGEVADR